MYRRSFLSFVAMGAAALAALPLSRVFACAGDPVQPYVFNPKRAPQGSTIWISTKPVMYGEYANSGTEIWFEGSDLSHFVGEAVFLAYPCPDSAAAQMSTIAADGTFTFSVPMPATGLSFDVSGAAWCVFTLSFSNYVRVEAWRVPDQDTYP